MKRAGFNSIRALRYDEPLPEGEPRRYRNGAGYVRLRWKVAPQRYVEEYEHRINAGRPHPRLHVHHVNRVKDDNRPENLLVLTAEAHGALHEDIARIDDPMRGKRFGGHRSAEAQRKEERRLAREKAMKDRSAEMRAMYADGMSTTEIGAQIGVDSSNVSRHLRSIGVLMRPRTVAAGKATLHRSHQVVHARSAMVCESCGRSTKWTGSQVHHRQPRQSGGSLDEWINLPSNLLLVCPSCHEWIERNRTQAYEWGYLLRRGSDPRTTPVLTPVGWKVYGDDGGVTTDFVAHPQATETELRDALDVRRGTSTTGDHR